MIDKNLGICTSHRLSSSNAHEKLISSAPVNKLFTVAERLIMSYISMEYTLIGG